MVPFAQLGDHEVIVSRTGYTGEDGCELWLPREGAVERMAAAAGRGSDRGAVPVGLGARDTLRLEAAMPLYGHELSEQIHPFQAGLGFAVQLQEHEFLGRDALRAAKEDTELPGASRVVAGRSPRTASTLPVAQRWPVRSAK